MVTFFKWSHIVYCTAGKKKSIRTKGRKEEIRINLVNELSIKCTNFQKCSITAYTRGCMPRIHRGVQHHRIHPGVHALHNLHRMKWCQAFFCWLTGLKEQFEEILLYIYTFFCRNTGNTNNGLWNTYCI